MKTEYLSRDASYSLQSVCVARSSCCPRVVERVNYRTVPLFGRRNCTLMNTGTMATTLTSHHLLKKGGIFLCIVFFFPNSMFLYGLTYICNTWALHSVAWLLLLTVSATGRR